MEHHIQNTAQPAGPEAQADGRVMPACGFNLFHRGAAKGPGTPVPSWAKNAPHGTGTASARLRVIT